MSTPVVVIGFLLLIPCVVGILLCATFSLLVASGATAGSITLPREERSAAISSMQRAQVPVSVINAVVSGNSTEIDEWLNSDYGGGGPPPLFQQAVVKQAQSDLRVNTFGLGFLAVLSGGIAFIVAICCFIGGLLGWLLVMKKRVLQCSFCRCTISAS
jgi:hypothetical protein